MDDVTKQIKEFAESDVLVENSDQENLATSNF